MHSEPRTYDNRLDSTESWLAEDSVSELAKKYAAMYFLQCDSA